MFVLAVFVGFEVISKVPTMLHTPLMSGTNAIHGIVIVGAILVAGSATAALRHDPRPIAVVFGAINVVGGFLVTDRMLQMFSGRPAEGGSRSEPPGPRSSSAYLACAITFIVGLKRLSSPAPPAAATDRRVGMPAAIIATLVDAAGRDLGGSASRWSSARRSARFGARREDDRDAADGRAVQRRRRRRRGAGRGGRVPPPGARPGGRPPNSRSPILLSAVVGSVWFAGSIIAFGKLQELIPGAPITYPGQQIVNALIAVAIVVCAAI